MSEKNRLNMEDLKKQLKSAVVWLIPLVAIYFLQIYATLQTNHILKLSDFQATQATIGAMELWVANQIYGLVKRFRAGE